MKSIIFSTEMIKAILEGRKTQTRRLIKRPQSQIKFEIENNIINELSKYNINDIVYVKEKYAIFENFQNTGKDKIIYEADQDNNNFEIKYKSPLFMPEKYSRLKLKIYDIKVEKLHEISDYDCLKEGIKIKINNRTKEKYQLFWDYEKNCFISELTGFTARPSYQTLFKSIYKKSFRRIWEKNPYVFVYDFVRIKNEMV